MTTSQTIEPREPFVVGSAGPMQTGWISTDENCGFVVSAQDGSRRTLKRALSCMVEPRRGDLVLFTTGETESYILAVLERPESEAEATAPLCLSAPTGLEIKASSVTINSETVSIVAKSVNIASRFYNSLVAISRRLARVDELTVGNRTVKAGNHAVLVDNIGHDHYKVHTQVVDGPALHKSDATFFKAKGDIRFDGERFTMG